MAYVLSSLSGNLISAASAGFAPTNSADVSAIASSYQVVSATATQLNAGTAYLTSVNETPISAARAGNAANASLANSAWYDGTGRMISALPDEATVSGIASAYAESAVSSKQDTLTFGYDDSTISSINGSAIAGGGGGGSTISTGEFLGYTVVSADNGVSVVGNSGVVSSSVSVPYTDSTWATNTISANSNKSQFRIYNFNRTAGNMTSLPTGNSVRIRVTAATPGQSVYTDDQIHLIVYTGTNSGSPIGNWQVQSANGYKSAMWDKTVTWNSTNQPNMLITAENFNTYAFSTTALYSAVGTGSSASESSYTADVLAVHPSYVSSVASAYVESAVSSKADSSALSSYVPYSSLEYNTASAISGINGSALAAGSTYSAGEGIDITDDVISVEAPVDIVAGPGIVIDNPDGNTLRVSTDENYEVELYSHTSVANNAANTVLNMNEPVTNFERIRVECWNREFNTMRRDFEFTLTDSSTSTRFIADMDASQSVGDQQRVNIGIGYNSDGNLVDLFHGLFYGNGSSYTNGNDRGLGIHRVVGIHRIQGGN